MTEAKYLAWEGAPQETWDPPMLDAWSNTSTANKDLAATVFGPLHEPGLFYRIIDPIDGPGIYQGYARDGTLFTLEIYVASESITHYADGKPLEGDGRGRYIFGAFVGPVGTIGIEGVLAITTRPNGINGMLDQMVFVDSIQTPEQTQTWRSTGLIAIAAKDPGTVTANEENLMQASSGQSTAEARNCLKPDLLTAAACISAAVAAFVLCHKAGMTMTIAGLIKCMSLLSIPFFGVAAAALCAAAMIALRLATMTACRNALAAAFAGCLGFWGEDIVNCKLEELIGW